MDNTTNGVSIRTPGIVLSDPLSVLGLPTRIENALANSGVETISDLLNTSTSAFYKFHNIGPKYAEYLDTIKNQLINEETRPGAYGGEVEDGQLIDSLLSRCGEDRSIEIVKRRYGLESGEKQTLEEIGVDYRLTRERIRQIIEKAIRKMRHPSTASRTRIIEKLQVLFMRHGWIINDEEADIFIAHEFPDLRFDGSSFLNLISDLGWIQSYRIGDVTFYSVRSESFDLEKLMEIVVSILKKNNLSLTIGEIVKAAPHTLKVPNSADRGEVILRCVQLDPRIEEKIEGYYGLFSGHGSTQMYQTLITEIFKEAQLPLHFTEISERLNDRLKNSQKTVDVRRVHFVLIYSEMFAHTGIRGMYGLIEWGIKKESTPDLVAECLQKAGFPLHLDQIYDYVKRYKDSPKGNIKSILEFNRAFEKSSEGLYRLKTAS
jgi:hypothetical protein